MNKLLKSFDDSHKISQKYKNLRCKENRLTIKIFLFDFVILWKPKKWKDDCDKS